VRPFVNVDPDAAREEARAILGDRRYQEDPAPRPFRGPLEWIGERLEPIGRWLGDIFGAVPVWVWPAFGITLVALIILWAVRRADRVRTRTAAGVEADAAKPEDPVELERAAAVAEQAGDFERAVRLRFRAGLLRLGRRGAIDYRPSVTTAEVRRELVSERFERLAGTFEHVAYGGRPATPPDADEARTNWPQVLEESAPR
jgi:hypothetical protein